MLCIDADCAFAYWMSLAEKPAPCSGMSHETLTERFVSRSLPDWAYAPDGSTHVLVTSKREFINRNGMYCRVASTPLPRNSSVLIDKGLHVVSPEYCFLRLAGTLSFPELVKAGSLLCSSFYIDEFGCMGERRDAITSSGRIASYVNTICHVKGAKNARRAIRFLADHAASPPEIDTCLLLCLPVMCGGYGCPMPELNGRVRLNADAARSLGYENCYCDLLWRDAKCAVEYTSELHHTGYRKQSRDEIRRAALESMGYRVFFLTKPQLYNQVAFEGLARLVVRTLGKRFPKHPLDFQAKQYGLRRDLLYKPSWIIKRACRMQGAGCE